MDRLQTMSVFVAVAEEKGFAPAARQLNLSPPSVTRAISELESRLGARLFHRTTRLVSLTDAGGRYLADCRRILAEIEAADRHAAGLHAQPRGVVSVSASVLFGRMVVTPALADLLQEYPEITVNAMFVDRIVHMYDEGVDVAVRIAELPDSSLSAIRVGSVRRVLCASPGYLSGTKPPDEPPDLVRHTVIDFVAMTPGGEWTFVKEGKKQTFRPQARLRVNNADAAITAAGADRGITRVLSYMVRPQFDAGALVPVLEEFEPPPVPVYVVHKEAGQTSARVRAVVDYLVERLRNNPALNGTTR